VNGSLNQLLYSRIITDENDGTAGIGLKDSAQKLHAFSRKYGLQIILHEQHLWLSSQTAR
jgi:hypothetical protein